jgi:hypothetical protein
VVVYDFLLRSLISSEAIKKDFKKARNSIATGFYFLYCLLKAMLTYQKQY